MSFNDDLNNFVHNYPYTNYHELVLDFLQKLVAELQKIVEDADLEHINERLAAIDSELAADAAKIAALESASTSAADAINSLRAITAAQALDLEQIHAAIDGVIEQIGAAVDQLEDELGDLETDYNAFKASTNTAISTLNQAAFDPSQIVMSSNPFNFVSNVYDCQKAGWRIVVDGTGSDYDSIRWVTEGAYTMGNLNQKSKLLTPFRMPQFERGGNECHLIIPNVLPYLYNQAVNVNLLYNLYFYANRYFYDQHGANIWVRKVGPVSTPTLLSNDGYVVENVNDDYMIFFDMELVANQDTGNYDLWLHNGRNGKYCTIDQCKFSSIIISQVDYGRVDTWEGAQRYFNALNCYGSNAIANADSRIAAALVPIQNSINTLNAEIAQQLSGSEFYTETFTPTQGITLRDNKTMAYYHNYSVGDTTYRVQMWFIDLSLEITDLADDTNLNVGSFGLTTRAFNSAKTVNTDILHANNGCYGSIGTDGAITIHPYGNFGSGTTQVRITAAFVDKKELT